MPELSTPESRLFVALDYNSLTEAEPRGLLSIIGEAGIGVKIGTQIAGAKGWKFPIERAQQRGAHVFADTKLHDIPNTVAATLEAHIFPSFPYMVNMHADAGADSLAAFLEVREKVQKKELAKGAGSLAIAVTVLTSKEKNLPKSIEYADMAANLGFDGIVCSGHELAVLSSRKETKGLLKVIAGIRPVWADAGDQKRIMTPARAIAEGATHLVVGRPITKPPRKIGKPEDAIEKILEEIKGAI